MDGWMDGWMDACMHVCMYVCMYYQHNARNVLSKLIVWQADTCADPEGRGPRPNWKIASGYSFLRNNGTDPIGHLKNNLYIVSFWVSNFNP